MKTFTVADNANLIRRIRSAQHRLVYIAPGVFEPVADALIEMLSKKYIMDLRIVIDADEEACRLGFGEIGAVRKLKAASERFGFVLCYQPGIRLGVLLSDADVLVWSPTPLLVEDQSHKEEKPNAIDLQGGSIQKLEKAVGVVSAQAANEPANELFPNAAIDQEIGLDPLPEDKLKQAELALERNPPKAFDLARQERVFNSKLEFVELSLTDYKMSKKVMPVSSELMALSDDEKTKNKWRNQFTLFENHDCKVKLTYKKRKIDVDEAFLDAERKRLDKEYLVAITGYGKVIPIHLKQDFQREIESFRTLLKEYTEGIQKSISKHLEETVNELVLNLLPRFKKNPPPNFKKRQLTDKVGDDEAKGYIRDELENASCKIEQHVAPKLRVVYKAINYESFHSNDFVEKLNNAFGDNATDRIFEEHDSARGKLK